MAALKRLLDLAVELFLRKREPFALLQRIPLVITDEMGDCLGESLVQSE